MSDAVETSGAPGGGFPSAPPAVSVVIPTRNRPASILSCLETLKRQTLAINQYEIIIVDDGSSVPISKTIAAGSGNTAGDQTSCPRVIRLEQNRGPGAARNAGVAAARGALIAFTDDDCLPDPDWLERLWSEHNAQPHAMLGGRIYNAVPQYLGAEASQVIADIVYAWYNADPQAARFFSTNNMAMPRDAFLRVGGFCEAFRGASEDRDLCDRWRSKSGQMLYIPAAKVGHAHRLTIPKFARQHFGYGRGAATFHHERTARGSGTIQDEMPFHRALPRLARHRLKQEPLLRKIQLTAMLLLWQITNAAGYAWEKRRSEKVRR